MRITADVAVLGGGPAGATAARLLTAWGRRVVVLARGGARRALAESLPPSGVRALERLGVARAVEGAGALRATGNTAWWAVSEGAGEGRVERFAAGEVGLQVERAAFDRTLLAAAVAAGVEARRAVVRGIAREADGEWRVAAESAEGAVELHAPWLLDCTGRAGVLARRGWRRSDAGPRTMAIVAVWERASWEVPDATHTLVESFADGWAWSVPTSPTRRQVTVMVDPAGAPVAGGGGEALARAYRRALRGATRLARLVEGARLVDAPWARDASVYGATRRGEAGALLVGDAASFADPLSSFGVKKAIASARLAAVVAHSALAERGIVDAALAMFESRERAMSERLRAGAAAMALAAAEAHGGAFWAARAASGASGAASPPPNVEATSVRRALDALRARATMRLQLTGVVERGRAATVRGNRVVLEECLVAPAFPAGVRWWGNVDVPLMARLVVAHEQVPTLWQAYNREAARGGAPAVDLPELLGALSTMIAAGVLDFA